MRLTPFAIFIFLTGLLSLLLVQMTEPKIAGKRDMPFPTLTITSMDGKTQWKQEDLQGRVTILNFFASWCTPCAAEMPELAALKKQFPNTHLEGVAWNDKPDAMTAWLKKHNQPFSKVWYDKNGDATIALGIRGIPETFIIDSKGIVRYRIEGPLTESARNVEVGALIEKLVKEAHAQ